MRALASIASFAGTDGTGFKRILAILEGCDTDDAVSSRAIEAADVSGGFLTLVAVVDVPTVRFDGGSPIVAPSVTGAYLAEHVTASLSRSVARIPEGTRFQTGMDEGKREDVISRRVRANAHDLVVLRRRSFRVVRPLWATLTSVFEVIPSHDGEAAVHR